MIIPVTLVLALYALKKQTNQNGGACQLSIIFPWFVVGFAAASVIRTFLPISAGSGKKLA